MVQRPPNYENTRIPSETRQSPGDIHAARLQANNHISYGVPSLLRRADDGLDCFTLNTKKNGPYRLIHSSKYHFRTTHINA